MLEIQTLIVGSLLSLPSRSSHPLLWETVTVIAIQYDKSYDRQHKYLENKEKRCLSQPGTSGRLPREGDNKGWVEVW